MRKAICLTSLVVLFLGVATGFASAFSLDGPTYIQAQFVQGNQAYSVHNITNTQEVHSVARLIGHMPKVNPGIRNCPFDNGLALKLSFLNLGADKPYARAVVYLEGCQFVTVKEKGHTVTLSGYGLTGKIVRALRLHVPTPALN